MESEFEILMQSLMDESEFMANLWNQFDAMPQANSTEKMVSCDAVKGVAPHPVKSHQTLAEGAASIRLDPKYHEETR
jgi:hypothetical protein